MKIKQMVMSVLAALVLYIIAADAYGGGQSPSDFEALMKYVEISGQGNLICQSSENNYIFRTSGPIIVPVNEKPESDSTKVTISKWENNSWQQYGLRNATFSEGGQLEITSGIGQSGLYKLEFETLNNEHQGYALVCDDWKKLVFSFCRGMKDYLEINSDAELILSTIAVSHFDHVMESAASAEIFSDELFIVLRNAIKAREDFDNGKIPNFVIPGMTRVRLKRFKADGISEFIVCVPEGYNPDVRYPVVARIDPFRLNILDDYNEEKTAMIDLWWHFGSDINYDWKDFDCFFKIMKGKLAIDSNRIYLHSFCKNSPFAMSIALKYPDIWAACMMSTGYNNTQLAGNIANTQFFYANAHPEVEIHKPKIDFVTKCFSYFGCNDFHYAPINDIGRAHLVDFTKLKSRVNPDRLYFKTQSYQSNKSYWLSVEGCEDDNFSRIIEAEIKGNKIFITTENIDAYKIYLSSAPIERFKPVEIIENGNSLGFCDEDIFVRAADRYAGAVITKTPEVAGPIEDVFSEPYVIVYQSSNGEPNYLNAVVDFAESISPLVRCIKDTVFNEKYIEADNIIFVGRDSANLLISEILKKLPVTIAADVIMADNKKYQGENMGCIMIYPNPLNTSKYILLVSPTSQTAADSMAKVLAEVKSEKDITIFDADEKRNVKYHVLEKFDSLWQWSKNTKLIIFNNNIKKSAVDYQKLIAKVIKDYLKADISILEPVFTADESVPIYENVVLRDLFANLQNHWIIKIKIKGTFLKLLVNKLLAGYADGGKITYALSGISFNTVSDNDGLRVIEIENDKDYTIALSETTIKNPLLGYVLTDYEILDQSFLIKLLKDYTQRTGLIDLNQECENIKIF